MRRCLVPAAIVAATLAAAPAHAQRPPSTDVFVARLLRSGDSVRVESLRNITHRPGYDNQPSFAAGGLFFTSVGEDAQSDIHRYDLAGGTITRLTTTPESEYSATLMPGGRRFSVVRVERDSAQRLWSFALDGSDPRLVLDSIAPVGYHAWLDDHTLALFVLGSPNSLRIADTRTGRASVVAHDIGRSLVPIPGAGRAFSFVQRADGAWWLVRADVAADGETHLTRLGAMPDSADYVAWTYDGRVLAARGSALLIAEGRPPLAWRRAADLSGAGITSLSRLAISTDGRWLALVGVPAR